MLKYQCIPLIFPVYNYQINKMPVLRILTIPDPVLYKPCDRIAKIDDNIVSFAKDLLETMHFYKNCVGLAAPQAGKNFRLVVVNVGLYPKPHPNNGEMVLINPSLKLSPGRKVGREGCLSVPDMTGNVYRADQAELEALNLDGNIIKFTATGFEAVVLQHEIDHLDGIVFLDRVVSLKTDVFRRKTY